ncbi:type II toxin-antitoxin system HipA family toxin [Microbacterium sp. NPDC055683]
MTDAIEVWIDDAPVGDVQIERRAGRTTESMTFGYRDGWLSRVDAFAISPDLPLQRGPQVPAHHRSTFLAFDDAAPDAWGRGLLRAAALADARRAGRRFQPPTEIDLLLRVDDATRHGAVRFRRDGVFLGTGGDRAAVQELRALVDAARRFEETGEIDRAVEHLIGVGSSPGGARPKAWVRNGTRLVLAKFPRAGDPFDVSAWEDATARMMRAAGIRALDTSTLLLEPGQRVLLAPRFDREGSRRIAYISFRSIFGMADGDRSDYATLASAVARISSSPADDAAELFRRAAFSAFVNGHDDHMRNHGFLREASGWRLAPAFDVNPSNRPGEGTPLVPGGDPYARDVRELLDHAESFRITRERATGILGALAATVSRWREFAVGSGVESDALGNMRRAFAEAEGFKI